MEEMVSIRPIPREPPVTSGTRFANSLLISVASPVTVREDVDLSQALHIPQLKPGNHGRECSVSGIGSCDLLR